MRPKITKHFLSGTSSLIFIGLFSQPAAANCFLNHPKQQNFVCSSYDFDLPFNVDVAIPSGNSADLFNGVSSRVSVDVTADLSGKLTGLRGQVKTTSNQAGTIASAYGTNGNISHGGAGTITSATAMNASITNSGSGSITTAAGLAISAPTNIGTGSIDTYYGLFVNTPSAATNNFSIYSQGGKNYFGGDIEINETATLKVKTICDITGSNCKDVSAGWGSGGGGSGTVTNITTGTGLTGGPITTSGTIAVDVGTTANKIVQLDTNGALPAVDGSNLTNISANEIGGQPVNVTTPAFGQFLHFNGATWHNKTLNISDVTHLMAQLGNKIDSSSMPPSCYANQTLTYISPTGNWSCTYIAITPDVFGTQPEGMILAAPTSNNGTPTFRKIAISDLPAEASNWQSIDNYIAHNTSRVGVGVLFEPEAQFDSYYTLPAPQPDEEYIASRGQVVIKNSFDYEDSIIGSVSRILIQPISSGIMSYINGHVANVTNKGSATIGTAIGLSAAISNAGSGNIDNAIGIMIPTANNAGTGEVRVATGLFLMEQTAGTDLNYSIYSQGGDNYFGGNMHVDGVIKATQICDTNGLHCKTIESGWDSTPQNLAELNKLKLENESLKKQLKAQENRLSAIETMLSSKKFANK